MRKNIAEVATATASTIVQATGTVGKAVHLVDVSLDIAVQELEAYRDQRAREIALDMALFEIDFAKQVADKGLAINETGGLMLPPVPATATKATRTTTVAKK